MAVNYRRSQNSLLHRYSLLLGGYRFQNSTSDRIQHLAGCRLSWKMMYCLNPIDVGLFSAITVMACLEDVAQ